MQKHGGHESPPLVLNKKWVRMARSQLKRSRTAHSPQRVQATGFAGLRRQNPTHAEHQNVRDQQGRGHRSFLLAKESKKFLAHACDRETQLRTALLEACRMESEQPL